MKIIYLTILLTVCACQNTKQEKTEESSGKLEIRYARGFKVENYEGYRLVTLRNPWDTLQTLQQYALVDREIAMPKLHSQATIVKVPVKRIVASASPHCAVLNELNVLENVVGVCEPRYIDFDYIQKNVACGRIPDLGEASAPDIEQIITLNPGMIMMSPFQNSSYGRLSKLGIPIIECADYMESSPLGRAEWIRFYALFVGREAQADSLFSQVEKTYLELKQKCCNVANRPSVVCERKYGSVWYIPGGQSYMAQLYKDAGADYFFKENNASGSVPLSFEQVLEQAHQSDYWLIKYNAEKPLTYNQIKEDYELYSRFQAWKSRNIYCCNTAFSSYYEEAPLHPERLLEDLIGIFHPELSSSPMHFYEKMTE